MTVLMFIFLVDVRNSLIIDSIFRKLAHISDAMKEKHKKYACSYCEKRFLKKIALSQHENTHTGAKPYRCSMCDKGFSYCSEGKYAKLEMSSLFTLLEVILIIY